LIYIMKHIDPSEINIINYLSGEMSTEELNQFEIQLEGNQLLKAQVDELKIAQKQMGLWKDEDIEIPSFESLNTIPDKVNQEPVLRSKRIHLPSWVKYVAIFLGFVMFMQIAGFKVNHDGNTLLLSLGEPNTESLNAQDVDAIVAKAIDKYASEQNSHLNALQNHMESELSEITFAVNNISQNNSASLTQLENLFSRNMDEQYVSLESMIRGIEDNQRQEIEDSFTGLVEYIENKRIKDQYKIQNAFSEIATAINNQQYQTDALLTSISEQDQSLKSY